MKYLILNGALLFFKLVINLKRSGIQIKANDRRRVNCESVNNRSITFNDSDLIFHISSVIFFVLSIIIQLHDTYTIEHAKKFHQDYLVSPVNIIIIIHIITMLL